MAWVLELWPPLANCMPSSAEGCAAGVPIPGVATGAAGAAAVPGYEERLALAAPPCKLASGPACMGVWDAAKLATLSILLRAEAIVVACAWLPHVPLSLRWLLLPGLGATAAHPPLPPVPAVAATFEGPAPWSSCCTCGTSGRPCQLLLLGPPLCMLPGLGLGRVSLMLPWLSRSGGVFCGLREDRQGAMSLVPGAMLHDLAHACSPKMGIQKTTVLSACRGGHVSPLRDVPPAVLTLLLGDADMRTACSSMG